MQITVFPFCIVKFSYLTTIFCHALFNFLLLTMMGGYNEPNLSLHLCVSTLYGFKCWLNKSIYTFIRYVHIYERFLLLSGQWFCRKMS